MPRRAEIQPRTIEADAVHGSVLVAQLVNRTRATLRSAEFGFFGVVV